MEMGQFLPRLKAVGFLGVEQERFACDDLLVQVRDGMRVLAEMKQPECRLVVTGLLLAIMDLSHIVDEQVAHLLCEIHADAQQAWGKSHPHQEESQE